tara:strand:- start:233 stop:583 length:351 start_codon:yes stop_codon:yes gene_type:complete
LGKVFQFIIGLFIFSISLLISLIILKKIIFDFSELYEFSILSIMNVDDSVTRLPFIGHLLYLLKIIVSFFPILLIIAIFVIGIIAWYQLLLVILRKKKLIDAILLFSWWEKEKKSN